MATEKTPTIVRPHIPIFYETIERSVTLKEGGPAVEALRDQLRAEHEAAQTLQRIKSSVERLTKVGAAPQQTVIDDVPVPRVIVTLHPGIAADGTPKEKHQDIGNGKVPNPTSKWIDTRPSLTEAGIDDEYDILERLYERLAALFAGLSTNADYIDDLFRAELDIPAETESYTLRSTYGVTGYVVRVTPPKTAPMDYHHR